MNGQNGRSNCPVLQAFGRRNGRHGPGDSNGIDEDAYQDTQEKLWEKVQKGELPKEVLDDPGYFWQSVKHRRIDLGRREQVRRYVPLDAMEDFLVSTEGNPEELVLEAEERRTVYKVCRWILEKARPRLSATEYQVLELRYLAELSPREVQQALQLASVHSVYSRKSAALRKLTGATAAALSERIALLCLEHVLIPLAADGTAADLPADVLEETLRGSWQAFLRPLMSSTDEVDRVQVGKRLYAQVSRLVGQRLVTASRQGNPAAVPQVQLYLDIWTLLQRADPNRICSGWNAGEESLPDE